MLKIALILCLAWTGQAFASSADSGCGDRIEREALPVVVQPAYDSMTDEQKRIAFTLRDYPQANSYFNFLEMWREKLVVAFDEDTANAFIRATLLRPMSQRDIAVRIVRPVPSLYDLSETIRECRRQHATLFLDAVDREMKALLYSRVRAAFELLSDQADAPVLWTNRARAIAPSAFQPELGDPLAFRLSDFDVKIQRMGIPSGILALIGEEFDAYDFPGITRPLMLIESVPATYGLPIPEDTANEMRILADAFLKGLRR